MINLDNHNDDHDAGFAVDLPKMLGRRRFIGLLGGAGAIAAAGPAAALDCVALPWETAGPFPGDGTNSRDGRIVNVLTQEGVIRQDLRASFGDLTAVADGARLDLELTLQDAESCAPLSGGALYIWACDARARYSIYNLPDANYLRGVGVADAEGLVRFTTVFPGCYPGRWPHFHFEVFASVDAAVTGAASLLTAQIALPEAECAAVYAKDPRYPNGARNLARVTLATDGVFRDNSAAELRQQTLLLSGDPVDGYVGRMAIPVRRNA